MSENIYINYEQAPSKEIREYLTSRIRECMYEEFVGQPTNDETIHMIVARAHDIIDDLIMNGNLTSESSCSVIATDNILDIRLDLVQPPVRDVIEIDNSNIASGLMRTLLEINCADK